MPRRPGRNSCRIGPARMCASSVSSAASLNCVPDNLKSGVNKVSFYDPEINRRYARWLRIIRLPAGRPCALLAAPRVPQRAQLAPRHQDMPLLALDLLASVVDLGPALARALHTLGVDDRRGRACPPARLVRDTSHRARATIARSMNNCLDDYVIHTPRFFALQAGILERVIYNPR